MALLLFEINLVAVGGSPQQGCLSTKTVLVRCLVSFLNFLVVVVVVVVVDRLPVLTNKHSTCLAFRH